MNKLGQFLLIPLIIILALVGIYLSGRLLTARNKMTKAFDDVYETNQRQGEEIATKQLKLDALLADISRESLGWEQVWSGREAAVVPIQGQPGINSNLGTNDGLGVQQVAGGPLAPHLYAFVDQADGVRFIGEMEVIPASIQAQGSTMRPTWLLAPGENTLWTKQVKQGAAWRFRTQIPQSYRAIVEAQQARLLRAFQNEQTLQQQIVLQQKLVELANEDLSVRLGELVQGNPDAVPQEDRPELSIGLVAAIEQAEELRNELQKDVDDLRRMIKVESDQQDAFVSDLQQLVGVSRPTKTEISQK